MFLPLAIYAILFSGSFTQIAAEWKEKFEEVEGDDNQTMSSGEAKSNFFFTVTMFFSQFGLFAGWFTNYLGNENSAFRYGCVMVFIGRMFMTAFLNKNPAKN